jgi:uncharacterized membrane protein YphA (DoxX/SURF4 family)
VRHSRFVEALESRRLTVRCAIVLGILFIVAAWAKIQDPPAFAQEVFNYALLPAGAVNLLAIFLPWLELLCGVLLFLGVWRRASAATIAAMLLVFIAALSINLARGRAVDCGCFGMPAAVKTDAQRFADMRWAIARDVGMLALALQMLLATRRRSDVLSSPVR